MKLRIESVTEDLLQLLRGLMAEELLEAFALGGGTALALRFGHRRSIDLDFFTTEAFDAFALERRFLEIDADLRSNLAVNSLSARIRGIKVDAMAHRYPLIDQVEWIEGIRLLSVADSAAMKLNAINNRGAKKDFWDLAELLEHFRIDDLLGFYAKKYPHANLWGLTRSLLYFDDAEDDPDPLDLKGGSWEMIKSVLRRKIRL